MLEFPSSLLGLFHCDIEGQGRSYGVPLQRSLTDKSGLKCIKLYLPRLSRAVSACTKTQSSFGC